MLINYRLTHEVRSSSFNTSDRATLFSAVNTMIGHYCYRVQPIHVKYTQNKNDWELNLKIQNKYKVSFVFKFFGA